MNPTAELRALGDISLPPLHPAQVLQLANLLSVALDDPRVGPHMRRLAEALRGDIREHFADCPAVQALIDQGTTNG